MAVYDEYPDGGAASAALSQIEVCYNPGVSGGVSWSGLGRTRLLIPMQGGAVVGGESPLVSSIHTSGGASAGGTHELTFIDFIDMTGGVSVGGDGDDNAYRTVSMSADGTVVVEGSYSGGVKDAKFNADGSVAVAGTAASGATFAYNLDFRWKIRTEIRKDTLFRWNIGTLRVYWYRIITKPNGPCGPLDPCCQTLILNVHARTPAELCEKLSKRRYKFPIASVQRFRRPASNTDVEIDEADGTNHDCNPLEPVEVCGIPQCADFCVDHDKKVSVGFKMKVQVDAFKEVTGSGSVFMSGAAGATYVRILPEFSHAATGFVTVGSETVIGTNSQTGRGGVLLSGVSGVAHTRWSFTGGVWPDAAGPYFARETASAEVASGDRPWSLTERVKAQDGLFASSDISFGKYTHRLVVRDFKLSIPETATILGLRVVVRRQTTQTGVRDVEVCLLHGDEAISENLAVTGVDWPLIAGNRTYGSNGIDSDPGWRAVESDPLTATEINSADFGIGIRVRNLFSSPAAIARIDSVTVEAFYEDEAGSIIRTSGSATAKSPSYHYTQTGNTSAAGDAAYRLGFRFLSTGLGSGTSPGVQMAGDYGLNLTYYGRGRVRLFGQGRAKSSYTSHEASGGSGAGGIALVTPYWEVSSGGLKASGECIAIPRYSWVGTGSIGIGGAGMTPEVSFTATATGGLTLGSLTRFRSSNHGFVSDGNALFVLGGATIQASDHGSPLQKVGFSMRMLDFSVTYDEDTHEGDAELLTGTVDKCGCFTLPLTIDLTHNLVRSNMLSQFLARNGYALPRTVQMSYNATNDSWQANYHFRGRSADGNRLERWDALFELQCTSSMGGINIGRSVWKLAVHVHRLNLSTGDDFETRVVVAVMPEDICRSEVSELDYFVSCDVESGFAVVEPNATVYQTTIYDNIGLFKTPTWTLDPTLELSVAQGGVRQAVQRVDLTAAVLL